MQAPRPNIVFILSDDHGYGDASTYGGTNIQTPNIDRIAREGIQFTQFYANSCVCSPSRAALLTGCYPDRVGVPGVIRTDDANSWGYFDPAATTLPQALKSGGYHSTIIGKWHLGLESENHPCARGFDEYRGFLGDMMDDYYTHRRHGHNYMRHNQETIDPQGHATDLFSDWAVETINQRSQETQPFFLYLAYNAPHTPIQPPDDWFARIREREPEISDERARYIALVEHMDAGIGRVLDAIEQTGVASNTLVIYASDNGGATEVGADNGPWRGAKQEMYEGGIRVPCCAKWPGQIEAGQVQDKIGILMDWFPTACELAGVDVSAAIDGRSLWPIIQGQPDTSDRYYYWVRREGGFWSEDRLYLGQDYHAARHGDMKLLRNAPFLPLELYDLEADSHEDRDLANSGHKAMPDLCRFMQRQVQRAGHAPWRPPSGQTA